VLTLCERALVAFERSEWDRAEILADEAHAALRRARREESYATPLVAAARARAALHRGDLAAVRRHLVKAQRLRPLLTYALPYFALQARIELARVYVALADLPGARTLMREIDGLLRRRPDMGNLAGEAGTLRAQLSKQSSASVPAASALTAAELRLLPMLSTHLSIPEIAEEMFLSRNTIKTEANSIYRKLGASSRSQAVTRSRELGLWRADNPPAIGAGAGKLLHHKTASKLERQAGETIPVGGVGLILAYPHSAAAKVEPAITRAIKKVVGQAEGHRMQALKGAIADAQQRMAADSTRVLFLVFGFVPIGQASPSCPEVAAGEVMRRQCPELAVGQCQEHTTMTAEPPESPEPLARCCHRPLRPPGQT
jgi:DNA-binding CsgD family transcriptional regulator